MPEESLAELARAVGEALSAIGWRLATAESCTGGWIAKCLTDIAGSSRWFERGYVTYSNLAKQQTLGVAPGTLETFGAVSERAAIEMATGALRASGTDLAVAVTGIAGPDGGTADKPVGLVWFALAAPGAAPLARRQQLAGDREAVRRAAVAVALRWVRSVAQAAGAVR